MEKEIQIYDILQKHNIPHLEIFSILVDIMAILTPDESEHKEIIPEFLGNDPIDQLNNLL